MKKIAIAALAALTLAACGGTKTVYVVDSLPEDLQTTQPSTITDPKPRPTTTLYTPPANNYSSDEDLFIAGVYSMYPRPIYLSDYELLNMAYTICSTLDTGVSLDTVVAVIAANMPATTDMQEFVAAILASAIYNICPRHAWQVPTN